MSAQATPLAQPIFRSVRAWGPAWAVLALLGGVGWVLVIRQSLDMGNGAGTMGMAMALFLGMWVAMMAAMMLPAIGPLAALEAAPGSALGIGEAVSFGAGFLIPWAAYGLLAFAALVGVNNLIDASATAAKWLGVGILAGAGLYQLTGLKLRALEHCRMPMGAVRGHGPRGSFLFGLRDGGICVGCCWALMATFIALGVMNLALMVGLAALILAEKLLPRPRLIATVGAAALLVLAALAAVHPSILPGLDPAAGISTMPMVETNMGGM